MHTWVLTSVIILGSIAAGTFGLMLTRKFMPGAMVNTEESSVWIASNIYGIIGTIYMEDEWALMKRGESSPLAHAALVELWYVYTDMAKSEREHQLYGESVNRLNQLSESRRVRIFALNSSVPNVMWAVFLAGGVGMVLCSYLLPVKVYWQRKAIIACMIALIASSFILILELNRPFSGFAHVEATPFQFVLDNMQQLER